MNKIDAFNIIAQVVLKIASGTSDQIDNVWKPALQVINNIIEKEDPIPEPAKENK